MSDTEKPFTVSDRRHFTPQGRPREEEAGAAPATAKQPEPEEPTAQEPKAIPREGGETEPPPVDFSQFLLSLAAQAGALLSGHALPEGMAPPQALESARSIISILEMLRDKTDGRRTSDESALLDGLLFELRMAYVEQTRARST
jgi:hypothetical protein